MSSNTVISGYYGKVAALGDFVSYNLLPDFVRPWDNWLQEVLTGTRESLGEAWLDTYLTSPIYRFVLTEGVCGESAAFGVMIPSVDRVGRYFPFSICAPLQAQANPFMQFERHEAWFSLAEGIALRTLEADFEPAELKAAMERLDAAYLASKAAGADDFHPQVNHSGHLALRQTLDPELSVAGVCARLLNNVLGEVCHAYSIWSTKGSSHVKPSLLLSQGLPPVEKMAAFYDGRWKENQWSDNDPNSMLVNLSGEETMEVDPWDTP